MVKGPEGLNEYGDLVVGDILVSEKGELTSMIYLSLYGKGVPICWIFERMCIHVTRKI